MRLVYDLFPCQTASRLRGIGRFTHSLAEAMIRLRGGHDIYALANGLYPESSDALRQDLGPLLPSGHFATYTHTAPGTFPGDSATQSAVAAALVNHAYQALTPDAVLYATPFEGWGEQNEAAVPCGAMRGALRVTVLYDFIPWLFPEQYLNSAQGYRQWYERRLAALHEFDLLLAISESTRRDAIDILGIPAERVVNISGAASPKFDLPTASAHDISRLNITRPFVLYTGNADYRKNLDGMLRAYARLPGALRKSHQLVLNQVGDLEAFRRSIQATGLSEDELVITGHITDDELISLYTQCKLFVFPSLYEGFGLPILEAMACGAPVIAADNSSIPEVVGRSDLLFNAKDPTAIAAAMEKVLTNDALRKELAEYSIGRAKAFSWERSATIAWDAIEKSLAIKRASPPRNPAGEPPRARIAMVCPMLPGDSAATAHCISLLPSLARYFDIDLFVQEDTAAQPSAPHAVCGIYPHTHLAAMHDRYITAIYQMANSKHHAYMLPLMERFPGTLVLHDARLDAAFIALAERPDMEHLFENEILYCHGLQGLAAHRQKGAQERPPLLNRRVLESAQHLVLTNAAQSLLLMQAHPSAWLPQMTMLPAMDASSCAAAYLRAIHAAAADDPVHTIKRLADALQNDPPDDRTLSAIAYHAISNWELRKQPRILVDVTQLARTDARSGIQRVVRNIAREMCALAHLERPIELVSQKDGKLWRAGNTIASILGLEAAHLKQEISIHPGDTLLMIDSSWEQYGEFLPIFQSVRRRGGKIVTVVYDTIPLRRPELCLPALVAVFNRWFRLAVEQSDMLLCISRSTADDVRAYLAEHHFGSPRKLQINYWPLGADIAVVASHEKPVRAQVIAMTDDRRSPLFLMVGTIEPRKGHDFALDAFDSLWHRGENVRLCIAGGVGWMVADTMRRILEHPQFGKKLFFVEKFTDAEINLCYAAATGLISASVAEGFGLPIVEASLHQVPVLASDIPVFREVGGDGAMYFSLGDCAALAAKITQLSAMSPFERKEMAARVKVTTWRESAAHLVEIILNGKHSYHHVLPPLQEYA